MSFGIESRFRCHSGRPQSPQTGTINIDDPSKRTGSRGMAERHFRRPNNRHADRLSDSKFRPKPNGLRPHPIGLSPLPCRLHLQRQVRHSGPPWRREIVCPRNGMPRRCWRHCTPDFGQTRDSNVCVRGPRAKRRFRS